MDLSILQDIEFYLVIERIENIAEGRIAQCIGQGRLKIWTEHSTLILQISIPFELAQQKFHHFYN